MAESAAERAQRLLDLVPYLRSHPGSTVNEVASRFHVTKAEVIKDLNLLFLCGLPGYTPLELIDIAFDDEVINVIDAQNLARPRRLTESETLTLRIALQSLAETLPADHEVQKRIQMLLSKLARSFGDSLPAGALDIQVPRDKIILASIESALQKNLQIEITYINRAQDKRSVRKVSPVRIDFDNNRSSLVAWCHLTNGVRKFTISQIENCTLTDWPASYPNDEEVTGGERALIKLKGSSEEFQALFADSLSRSENSHDEALYSLRYFNREWMIRTAISFADQIEVIEPTLIREEIKRRSAAALLAY